MPKPPSESPKRPRRLRVADLRGAALLATQATARVTGIVEGVHQAVWSTLGGAPVERTRGLTGLVYRSIHAVNHGVGRGLDRLLHSWQQRLDSQPNQEADSPQRVALLAVLNGVLGDHLHATGNPLALPMGLHIDGTPWSAAKLPPAKASGKVLLLIHGLCMNDLQWHGQREGQRYDHGEALASSLGYTSIHLRYNSGRHISENGRELAEHLQQLVDAWPQPITELSVLAHSMGGLLIRSACHYAEQHGMRWPQALRNLVFLGTPHHGAPLERAGNWVDHTLAFTRFSAPFARIGQLRSAGITDLRHGSLLDEHWQGSDRFQRQPDRRRPVPLPAQVNCYTIAATLAESRSRLADRWLGDGLVPLPSALGQHADPQHALGFAAENSWIAHRTGHLELLSSPAVRRKLLHWLAGRQSS